MNGKSTKHTVLDMALAQARRENGCLLVKRLDRFSRRVSFISWLLEQGVDLEVVEIPNATTFQLHIYAALAEEERRMISQRTKAALKVAKDNGVVLGANGRVLAIQNHCSSRAYQQAVRDKRTSQGTKGAFVFFANADWLSDGRKHQSHTPDDNETEQIEVPQVVSFSLGVWWGGQR